MHGFCARRGQHRNHAHQAGNGGAQHARLWADKGREHQQRSTRGDQAPVQPKAQQRGQNNRRGSHNGHVAAGDRRQVRQAGVYIGLLFGRGLQGGISKHHPRNQPLGTRPHRIHNGCGKGLAHVLRKRREPPGRLHHLKGAVEHVWVDPDKCALAHRAVCGNHRPRYHALGHLTREHRQRRGMPGHRNARQPCVTSQQSGLPRDRRHHGVAELPGVCDAASHQRHHQRRQPQRTNQHRLPKLAPQKARHDKRSHHARGPNRPLPQAHQRRQPHRPRRGH